MKKTLTRQNKKGIVLFVLLALVMFFSCLGIERLVNKANASEPQVSVQEWKDEYVLGSTWTMPTDAKVEVGASSYDVTSSRLVYPDGKIYSKESYTLSQAGGYTAYFYAIVNGKEVSATKTFYVYNSAHNVPDGATIEYRDSLLMDESKSGLYVKIAEGTAYEYGSTIDISNADLSTPIATLHSFNSSTVEGASGYNKTQAQILVLRLTDAYDEDNYVDIELSFDIVGTITNTSLWAQGWLDAQKMKDAGFLDANGGVDYKQVTQENYAQFLKEGLTVEDLNGAKFGDYRYDRYFRAGTSEVLPRGFQVNASGKKTSWPVIEYEDAYYDLCKRSTYLGNVWGPYGARGTNFNPFTGSDPVEFYYEYETCKVYAKTYTKSGSPNVCLVADLRCEDAFDVPFKGFTTGEVRLSIFGEWYRESYLEFELSSVYGLTGDALKLENTAHETNKPIIKLPVTNAEQGEIVIAKDEPFTIFPYEIWDVSNIAESFVKVYYQYGSDKQIAVGVKDGKFTPKNVGQYTLVYAARDIYGNYAEEYVQLNSVVCANNQSLYLGFENDGDITLDASTTQEVSIGKVYNLPTPAIRNENPFDVSLSIYLLQGDKKTVIDPEINQFTLHNLGESTLCYEYSDAIQQKITTYALNCVPSNEVALMETPTMPKYFIKNTVTSLEVGKTVSYEFDGVEVTPDVWVSFDGGEYEMVDVRDIEITGEENVKVKYTYGEKVLFETPNPIPVIDVGYGEDIKIAKYFLGDFESEANENRIKFTANEESGDATLSFINPISFEVFKLGFEIQEATANFQTLEITITDYYDKNNTVSLIYGKSPIGVSYQVDGTKYEFTTQNFASSSLLTYNEEYQQFMTYAGDVMPWKNKFVNDKVYLSLTLHKMTGESAIEVSRINSQLINDSYEDLTKADITLVNVEGTYKLDSTLTINHPIITDVLSPYAEKNFVISIETPADAEGKIGYYTENGITYRNIPMTDDSIQITLNSYGKYRIRFTYTDSDMYMNKDARLIDVFVTDDVKPTFTLNNVAPNTTVESEVGKWFVIDDWTAEDNETATEDLYVSIIVIAPDSTMIKVEAGDVYGLYKKGVYTVYYMCYDEAGNYTSITYYVKAA